ncbi:MAG: ABC transporter substrate-binding protein [Nocardioides sp.]|uniref:ABC transporter substrate-binding protein n=1 Tax=Nocardioides sp. TaxID=35761 RepID=UPI003F07ED2D
MDDTLDSRRTQSMLRRTGMVAGALALALMVAGCTDGGTAAPEPSPTHTPVETVEITFGAYGSKAELKAMQEVVDSFNAEAENRRVDLVTWKNHDEALAAVLAGEGPDVFMSSRSDVGRLAGDDLIRPMSLLLDERGVDFGDRYSRDALDAFALDDELQCMAYSISPMVIYYNTDLIDFDAMKAEGMSVPGGSRERWTLTHFAQAAEYASRQPGVKGVWIEPTLEGLTPFIASGGGSVFDSDEPTSLNFSDDATLSALDRSLAVLRDPLITPSAKAINRMSALDRFKAGKLGMVAGYRDLVPELRKTPGLSFDVIAMPILDDAHTVGDIHGLCISEQTESVNTAADFVAYAVSDEALETVTNSGYIVPANTYVAGSDLFLAPDQEPYRARVFTGAIRGMVVPPFIENRAELNEAIAPLLAKMLTGPGVLDLEEVAAKIDEASRKVLDPEWEPPTEDDTSSN